MVRFFVLALVSVFATTSIVGSSPAIDLNLGLGILKRRSKPDSPERAKSLIATLSTDPDASKRRSAAQELRGFDPRTIPELIPALVGSLQKDPIPLVRMEAVDTIGRLKPISQMAGLAMESSLQTDPDSKVRDAIRAALFQYQINGYRTPPSGATFLNQSTEPPLAKAQDSKVPSNSQPTRKQEAFRPITDTLGKETRFLQSSEPPLAKPKATPTAPLPTSRGVPQQMPSTPLPEPIPAPKVPVATTPLPEIRIPASPSQPTLPVPSVPVPAIPVPPKK